MKTITADPALLSAIKQISEPTEIIDNEGNRLATVYPQFPAADDDLIEFAKKNFDLDKARRIVGEQHGCGVTTPELLERLRSLDAPT
jgi:hypothetical protein